MNDITTEGTKTKKPYISVEVFSDRDRIRTYDRLLRRQMLI